ncbi:MAG: hypothetical protein H7Z41_16165 [Cytophagales bacterium]|nr:hypothetical protein [Armatimonadota bacterium]
MTTITEMITKTPPGAAPVSRRPLLALLTVLLLSGLIGLGGCSSSAPSVALSDMTEITVDALTDLVLGPPEDPTRTTPTDPPLLRKGKNDRVVVAADTAAFAAISRGAIPENALKSARKDVVRSLDRRLNKKGFAAVESTEFPPARPTDGRTLVATLTPVLEGAGSPQDRAMGRDRQLVLIRLTITDPATGETLKQRDYYSGKDVIRPNATPTPYGQQR